jgi:UDP-2-acetamido-3-amino-2,3-dideoxy-glucuronate N-acetyltransferase
MDIKIIDFPTVPDERGSLSFFEIGENKHVPFCVKRIYYLFKLNELTRGFHAHKELKELIICLHGSCSFILDDGKERKTVSLSKETQGLFINPMTWREIHDITPNTVILVLASEFFDESDYIRNYDDFLKLV